MRFAMMSARDILKNYLIGLLFILVLILLALSACAPVPTVPTTDPYTGLALAQAQAEVMAGHLTATQNAWVMQQAAWTVTAQSWTPTASLTPVPTSTPTITLTPTLNATGTIAAEKMQAEVAEIQKQAEIRDAWSNAFYALPYLVMFIAVVFSFAFGYVYLRRLAMMPNPVHDGTGKPMPMFDVINGIVSDVDRAPNGMTQLRKAYIKSLPLITPERQDAVTERAQMVDLQTRIKRLPARLVDAQGKGQPVSGNLLTAGNEAGLFPLPDWSLVDAWQGDKKLLPYGLTANGVGYVNVDLFPHWAAIGMTGMGKSRRFMRPLIAFALAAGHRVVIIGKMTDYGVFANHPNATLVHVNQMTKPEHAEFYGAALLALLREMESRDMHLMQRGVSTWAQAGRQNTFIVLDEVQNAIRMMKVSRSANAERVQMGVAGLVSEGRKVGFNVAIAAQRATGLADVLSQTGKAIFRVEREEENAHKSLVGASNLSEGYFYARFGDVRLTGAFEPSDEQIRQFLASRPAQALEADWVDGQVLETLSLPGVPAANNSAALPTANNSDFLPDGALNAREGEEVVRLLRERKTPSAIVRELWGVTGGSKFLRLIDEVKGFQKFLNTEGVA
jgi:hypothetical protein